MSILAAQMEACIAVRILGLDICWLIKQVFNYFCPAV